MTREEQETVVRFDATKGDVEVYTADPSFARRMERFGFQAYRTTTIDGKLSGWFYRVPYSVLRFPFGRKRTGRAPSEAAKQALADFRKARGTSWNTSTDQAGRDNAPRTEDQGQEV